MKVPPVKNILPVYIASAETVDRHLDPELCRDPWPLVAATVGILSESEASPHLPDEAKGQVTDAIRFLGERLATLVAIVDPSAPAVNTANLLPTGAQRRAPARTMLQDIAKGMARRVPLTKLVSLDGDVRPYLASLLVSAMHRAGDQLVVPNDLKIKTLTTDEFENLLRMQAGQNYDNYGMIAKDLMVNDPPGKQPSKAELDRRQKAYLGNMLEKVAYALHKFLGEEFDMPSFSATGDTGTKSEDDEMMTTYANPIGLPDPLIQAVTKVASLVETKVPIVMSTPPPTPTQPTQSAGAAHIKQVRRAAGKLLSAKSVAPPPPSPQPHLEVAVQPLGVDKSK